MSTRQSIIALSDQDGEDQAEQDCFYPEVEPELPDLTTQRLNDTGNAQRFVAMFGADVHYSAELKRWLIWDGRRWRIDTTGVVQRLAKLAMLEFLWQAGDTGNKDMLKFAESSLNVSRLRHLLESAQSEPGIPIAVQELDCHPLLLNVPNGTLNLATQELDLPRRENLLTRLVNVEYDQNAQCPCWIAFLSQIQPPEMIPYLQRALAYCLSANVREKACFIVHGEPDAGKTTMLSIVRELLAEYSTLLQVRTLVGGANTSNAQSDLADLNGTRFVQTSECGYDEHLAQQALKAVVQGRKGKNHRVVSRVLYRHGRRGDFQDCVRLLGHVGALSEGHP
jgi:putative DNA primase/helicase